MSIANVLALIGGVALFLFGMQLMGDGLKKVAGNKLELVLWKLSGTPIKGILLGTFVTAVIQSSSATSAMVVGFVNSGMMTVTQSISVVMGANIGTSVTGWLLCLSLLGKGGYDLGDCRIHRHHLADVLEKGDQAQHRRHYARLCGADVRHGGNE